jgi:hypothetical protein
MPQKRSRQIRRMDRVTEPKPGNISLRGRPEAGHPSPRPPNPTSSFAGCTVDAVVHDVRHVASSDMQVVFDPPRAPRRRVQLADAFGATLRMKTSRLQDWAKMGSSTCCSGGRPVAVAILR